VQPVASHPEGLQGVAFILWGLHCRSKHPSTGDSALHYEKMLSIA